MHLNADACSIYKFIFTMPKSAPCFQNNYIPAVEQIYSSFEVVLVADGGEAHVLGEEPLHADIQTPKHVWEMAVFQTTDASQ